MNTIRKVARGVSPLTVDRGRLVVIVALSSACFRAGTAMFIGVYVLGAISATAIVALVAMS